jgi:hypothetical protein
MEETVVEPVQEEQVLTTKNYFLIFKDGKNQVLRVHRPTLNEIYKVIVDNQFPEGSYFIMEGRIVL